MDIYQSYIHKSRYARYLPEKNRREHWEETVDRYLNFMFEFVENRKVKISTELKNSIKTAILNLDVMPSMRAMMSAGKALERDNTAGFNCSYLPIDDPKAFDEAMHILMCFHPDTKVQTLNGSVKIKELKIGQQILSFNELTEKFEWKSVIDVIETPSANKEKYAITLENGTTIFCTHDHLWLTSNRGWTKASDLTLDDDLISPKFIIYKITNKHNGKCYIGYTQKKLQVRWSQHINESNSKKHCAYNNHFKNAIRKYGKNSWNIEAIDFAFDENEAHQKEINYISKFNTKNHDYGYNSTDGGDGASGKVLSEEQKKRMGKYKRTKEHRQKQKEILIKNFEKINLTRKDNKYKQYIKKRPRDNMGRFV